MVDLDAVDDPVRIRKRSRVRSNVRIASGVLGRVVLVAAGLLPEIILASIGSAEGGVEHNVMVLEVVVHNTVSSLGGEGWHAPGRGIGLAALDVGWDGGRGEGPHLDELGGPFHDHYSSSVGIERRAVVPRAGDCGGATLVLALYCVKRASCCSVVAVE